MSTYEGEYEIPELDDNVFGFTVTFNTTEVQPDVGLPYGEIEVVSITCDNIIVERLICNNDISYEAILDYFTDILIVEVL